jgi:hypothetical protein
MIATKYIKSVTEKIDKYDNFETINVLKWNNSKYKTLCPYYLRTDGNEEHYNTGNILFENYYQSCKIYDKVYKNEVYPSRFQYGNPKYLWWKYETINKEFDEIYIKDIDNINYENYERWRDSLWSCQNPIRYPNTYLGKGSVVFSLFKDKYGKEERLDYIQARKMIYVNEYIRLVRKTKEYNILLEKLNKGINLMICEIDVPAKHKKGNYKSDENIKLLDIDYINLLIDDNSEPFGHGLALSYALLSDKMK